MTLLRRLFIILTVCGVQLAHGDQTFVRLSSFPTMSVADARSTVTVTAQVVKSNGDTVPDGTQVFFQTTMGSFRDQVVPTTGGRARAILVAGGIPGTASITATCPGAAPATMEFEFLSDRALLSSAKEYVEIVAPGYMMFSLDQKLIGAAGPAKGARLRYREIEIEADDLQFKIDAYEVRARKARLHIGKLVQDFDQLYIRLNTRKGYGWTTFTSPVANAIRGEGHWLRIETEEKKHYGLAEITSTEIRNPRSAPLQNQFDFESTIDSASMVAAKKAVVFPHKEIQFQKAEILVGGVTVMKLPLYEVSLLNTGPILTSSMVGVQDNQLAINYPYYLSLKPGETSLLRFHTGDTGGRSVSGSRGFFLDYEMNWNRGDEMEGGLTFGNLARKDWTVGAHQYLRIDDRSTANAFFEIPAGRSIYGSASANRQFVGFQTSLSANANRSLRGISYNSQSLSFVAEKDPTKVGKLPVRMYLGLVAEQSSAQSTSLSSAQSDVGVRLRSQLLPRRLDSNSTLNASFSVSRLEGNNVARGLTLAGNASIVRQLGHSASVWLNYDYTQDPFTSSFVGKHRLSLMGSYDAGRLGLHFTGSRSLDVERMNYFLDMSYQMTDVWVFRYAYTYDKYFNDSFLDYNFTVGYKIGLREIGLTWSKRTKRIGIELLGAGIN